MKDVPSGAVFVSTIGCSFSRSQTSGRIGMQSCPRPCVIMKLTISGVDLFGRADEIAFVFAVFGVDDDDHLAATNRVDGLFDGGKMAGHVMGRAVIGIIPVAGRAIRTRPRFLL